MGMVNKGVTLSQLMQRQLPPAYRDGENEGEEANGGELSSEVESDGDAVEDNSA